MKKEIRPTDSRSIASDIQGPTKKERLLKGLKMA
jgi:hypothetical protein